MKKVYSVVWQFFDRLEQDKKCVAALCKLCDREVKYFGNTTNLRAHLTRRHPVQWEFRQKSLDEDQKLVVQPSVLQYEDHEGSTSSKRKRSLETTASDSKIEIETEVIDDDETTLNLVQQLHGENQPSDEEWLEDDYELRSYESPKKKHLSNIKREPFVIAEHSRHLQESTSCKHLQEKKDEYAIYGEYIANKIRKLKSQRTKGNIQQIISTILWQAEYGAYEHPDSVRRILMQCSESNQTSTQIHESTVYSPVEVEDNEIISDK